MLQHKKWLFDWIKENKIINNLNETFNVIYRYIDEGTFKLH
jgi:phage antirepressor YoqD-like protein